MMQSSADLNITGLIMMIIVPVMLWLAESTAACPEKLETAIIRVKDSRLLVELAFTPSARRCGLSHRAYLPEDRGMLFVFEKPEIPSFWMKDTTLFLSIAFLDNDGRIISIQNMKPMEIRPEYRSPIPVPFALEVNQGWFERHGIRVGDVFDLTGIYF